MAMDTQGKNNSFDPEELAKQLPRDVQPPKDLWPGIEARLDAVSEEPEHGPERRWWLQAAAAVAMVVASSIIAVVVMNDPGEPVSVVDTAPAVGEVPKSLDVPPWPESVDGNLGAPEIYAIETLPAEVREDVITSLADVRSARKAIEEALEQDPNNAWLSSLWMHAYEQEMELLEDAAWATNSLEERVRT